MDHKNSQSASYAAAGVDITAGYKAVELMKKHVARTRNEGCLDDVGGFGGCFGLPVAGMEEPVLVPTAWAPSCALPSCWTSTIPSALTVWLCASTM